MFSCALVGEVSKGTDDVLKILAAQNIVVKMLNRGDDVDERIDETFRLSHSVPRRVLPVLRTEYKSYEKRNSSERELLPKGGKIAQNARDGGEYFGVAGRWIGIPAAGHVRRPRDKNAGDDRRQTLVQHWLLQTLVAKETIHYLPIYIFQDS